MATRRMFSKDITDSDAFTDMPLSSQALYFHLGMSADDDGFVNSPKRVLRGVGASDDDMAILMAKNFVIPFPSGVVVIKHWKINNWVQSDRYHPTKYQEELSQLTLKPNKAYSLNNCASDQAVYKLDTACIHDVSKVDTEVRLGKASLGKEYILSSRLDHSAEISEIVDYLNERVGTKYKATTKQTVRHINARLDEGYSVDDFKAVIDCKSGEWLGGEMAKYLRPETLFGSKFEGYLNQSESDKARRLRYAKYD